MSEYTGRMAGPATISDVFDRFWTDQLIGITEAAEGKAKQLAARDLAVSKHQRQSEEQRHGR